jgi:hypothetical protein
VRAVIPLFTALVLLAGCASGQEREWQVAADADASADDIIQAGHAADVAVGDRRMLVTWEVEPEDDEGPYQGAWRLYDRKGVVADGTFGIVRESSAALEVIAVQDGFLLTDYVEHQLHIVDVEGRLVPIRPDEGELGTSLAGGVLLPDRTTGEAWQVFLPSSLQLVQLTELPDGDVQGIELTSDGTVWVLLPWTDGGPFRIAHAKDGKPPWTIETLPLPRGSVTSGDGMSSAGIRVFVAAGHARGDRTTIDAILMREVGEARWERVSAEGISDRLTGLPDIDLLRKGRLLATVPGEGAWVQKDDGSGFAQARLPRAQRAAMPTLWGEGRWLWSSARRGGNTLYYSDNHGDSWRAFRR